MSVIGDSISAGTGASGNATGVLDLLDAGQEQPENSWATGTAGGLNSVYQRLLDIQPAIEGKNNRRAVNGADMTNAPGQADAIPTNTEYVLIQMGGNDLCKSNESQMATAAAYRTNFTSTLTKIWNRSPNALVYVASIPDIYNLWYLRGAPNPPNPNTSSKATGIVGARTFWSGSVIGINVGEFPCQSLLRDATSYPGPAEDRRLRVRQRNIELNQVLEQECAKYKYCRFDDYALFNFSSNRVWSGPGPAPTSAPLKPANLFEFTDGDISGLDHFHPSVAGQRKLADMAWRTSFDFSDRTAPAISSTVATSIGSDGKRRVDVSATDAAGIRALEYRVHLPTGTSGWTSVLNTETAATSVPVYADQLAWVETRALDRNGNMSAGSLATVYPLPGAPSGPTFRQLVQNGVEGIRVTWEPPADERLTRGTVAPTVAYEATASPGGQSCRTQAASLDPFDLATIPTGCLISGLSVGQSYSFTVRAITQGGPGTAATARKDTLSGATSAVYLGPSGPVDGLTVTPSGTDLVVRWSPPANLGGGSVKGYEVRSVRRSAGGDPTAVTGCTTTTKTFPGKPPETVYFTANQCTLRNVVRLEDYDVEVRAFTELPTTPRTVLTSPSASASGWLPDAPGFGEAPTASVAVAQRTVTVTWLPFPATQLTTGATVTVTAQPGGASCTVAATETSCAIGGLSPLVTYGFTVVVNNGVGTASGTTTARMVVPAESVAAFLDIKPGNFAEFPARWLLANGVTTGTNAASTLFSPSQNLPRGQLAQFLWRLEGRQVATVPCGITDVAGAAPGTGTARELASAVCWMKQAGITSGSTYRPTANLTRGDMALFLWRLRGSPASSASCGFSDVTTLGDTGRAACWLRTVGVIDPKATYDPKNLVTRGQMAKFLYNIATRTS